MIQEQHLEQKKKLKTLTLNFLLDNFLHEVNQLNDSSGGEVLDGTEEHLNGTFWTEILYKTKKEKESEKKQK